MDISPRACETTCPGSLLPVMDELPSAIVLIDDEGRILLANRAAQELFGVPQDDVVGMPISAFAKEYIAPLIAEKEHAGVIQRVCSPAGQESPLEFLIAERRGAIRTIEYMRRTIASGDLRGTRIDIFRDTGEKRGAGERPGRDTLLSILKNAPYGVALIEPDGAWTYTNDTFTGITGYTHEEIRTLDGWLSRAHPNPSYRNRVIEIWMEDLIKSGITSSFSVVCRDGRVREIEIRPTTISDGRLLLAFLDVTERTVMEEQLQQTTSELSAVIDAFPDLFLRVSFDGTVLEGRAGRYAHHAIEHQQYLGRRLQDIFPGELAKKFHESVLSVCTGYAPQSLEYTLPSCKGVGSFEARIIPLSEKEVAVIMRDITESKRMEHELRLSEDRYRTIFETTGSATAILEEDGRISLANAEFKASFGHFPEDDERGLRWTDLLIEPDRERMRRCHQEITAHPDVARKEYELHCLHTDGSIRDVIMVIDLVPGTRRCVLSLLDITERKQAETQIRAQLREKEVLIKEIHHRVKNNLQIISSLLTLQSHISHDPAISDVFQECQNRIRSLSLIHESLYQAKDLGRIDFAGYLQRLVGSLLSSYGVKPDRIHYRICAENIFLNIDTAIPCGLIVSELVSNCLKHAFPVGMQGAISIEMTGSGAFCLRISDTGIGFPEDLDFRRTESLGMQLVCSLAGQLNGTIELFRDCGTRFEIRFTEPNYRGRGVI